MKYKSRLISRKLHGLVEHFSIVILSGARQVGKSTLLKHQFPDWNLVTFDPIIDIGNARADPALFLQNNPCPLILDEIQYCPELVSTIKRRVDEDKRPGLFILTGSQQWSVMKSISESLAGRAVFIDLAGFSLSEMAENIPQKCWLEQYLDDPAGFLAERGSTLKQSRTLYEQLWRGTLPEMDRLPGEFSGDYFSAYLRTYVERDVRLLLEAADWQQFGRFMQLAAALSAQEVNHSQFGRDIGITPQTANRWLSILNATFQWFEIPAWHGNTIKRISSKPKGYLSDTGLACHLTQITSPKALGGHPMTGALFESFVISEIRKMMTTLTQKAALYHWRLHSGSEVDLILERDGTLYPIEIKLTTRPSKKDVKGIAAFKSNYPNRTIAPGLVIAPVDKIEKLFEDAYAIPWNSR